MKIDIICAALPPQVDGIGDYSARIAERLGRSEAVQVLTALGQSPSPIPGVGVRQVFRPDLPRSVRALLPALAADAPDWALLQYNPFSYGRWGLNPHLPEVLRRFRASRGRGDGAARLAVMMHEPFVPTTTPQFAVMATWQRWQLWRLGRAADVLFCSIDPWARRFARWFPHTVVRHLPVGSNIPLAPIPRREARERLGIADGAFVLGLFGSAHQARLVSWVRDAALSVQGAGREVLVLYMGPHGDAVRRDLGGVPTLAEGPLPPDEVSRRFAAVDVSLAPFIDGVSTRRTSLMTALQHGVPTVGTRGPLTDALLDAESGRSLLLADVAAPGEFNALTRRLAEDPALREKIGRGGQELYRREFDWPPAAGRLLETLRSCERGPTRETGA